MSDKVSSPSGLAKWSALPPDFVLQFHIDKKGHGITERVCLTKAQQDYYGTSYTLSWAENCSRELRVVLNREFSVKNIKACSDVRPDGTIEVYLHADLKSKELGYTETKRLEGSKVSKTIRKDDPFVIDI